MMNIDEVFDIIYNYMGDGDYELAIRYCNRILKAQPKNIEALDCKAESLAELTNYKEALECYDKIIEINSDDNNEILYNKASLFENLEKYDKAIECYNGILENQSDDTKAMIFKGIAYEEMKEYEEALECYNKIIEVDPKSYPAHNRKGIVLLELEKYEEVIQISNKAIKIEPKYQSAYKNKANALEQLNKYNETIICYDKLIKLETKNPDFLMKKGELFFELNDKENAIIWIKKGLKQILDLELECADTLNKIDINSLISPEKRKQIEEEFKEGFSEAELEKNKLDSPQSFTISDFLDDDTINKLQLNNIPIDSLIDEQVNEKLNLLNYKRKNK